jgi:hypothetical protein
MAITPYLIEVIGIDLWHAVEFSRYGCALIPGLTTTGRARPPPPKGQKEKPRPLTLSGQIAHLFLSEDGAKVPKNKVFWLQGSDFATRPGVEVRCRSGRERLANQRKTGKSGGSA